MNNRIRDFLSRLIHVNGETAPEDAHIPLREFAAEAREILDELDSGPNNAKPARN